MVRIVLLSVALFSFAGCSILGIQRKPNSHQLAQKEREKKRKKAKWARDRKIRSILITADHRAIRGCAFINSFVGQVSSGLAINKARKRLKEIAFPHGVDTIVVYHEYHDRGSASFGKGYFCNRQPIQKEVAKPLTVEKLTRTHVIEGIKKNAATVTECFGVARLKYEIAKKKIKVSLSWKIKADGSVTDASFVGPVNLLKTSLADCFTKQMLLWKFPISKEDTPISNFPFDEATY